MASSCICVAPAMARRWTVLGHYGTVIIDLFAVAALSAPRILNALNRATPHAFGIKRAAAVIVLIFGLSLAAMFLGGQLRASLKRKSADKQH